MYQIESNIPIPELAGRKPPKYPFDSMNVGDSFRVSAEEVKSARQSAFAYARRKNVKFSTRHDGDGLRIWKTA